MTTLYKLLPEYLFHKSHGKQMYFWFDDNGRLYYGPDENNVHFPQMDELYGKFPLAIKDLENAFKLGKESIK